MNALSLMRFLNVNHSVRLIADHGRRFVLPSGPAFPRFGVAARFAAEPRPVPPAAPGRTASLVRVAAEMDLFDDSPSSGLPHKS